MDGLDDDVREIRELQLERAKLEGRLVNFGGEISYDRELLGADDKGQFETSIAVNDDDEQEERSAYQGEQDGRRRFLNSFTAPKAFLEDTREKDFDPFKDTKKKTIRDKEDEYHARWRKRKLSPPRVDAFSKGANNPEGYSYKDHMLEVQLENERQEVLKKIAEKQKEEQKQKEEEKKRAKKEMKKSKKAKRDEPRNNNNNDDTPPGRKDDFAEWKLEVSKRGAKLPAITLDVDMTINFGRGDSADVKLEHESCSKNHAKITFMSNTPHIMDLNSTNGTFVNGSEMTPGEWKKLAENDVIKFGCSTREYKVKCL